MLFFAFICLVAPLVVECRLGRSRSSIDALYTLQETDPALIELYPEYNLSVPIDHFHNDSLYEPHSNETFNLRYWFDASYYQEGGPVILFESGEDDAQPRLPILYKGIVHELAKATRGIGVIIEHRYYGKSMPFGKASLEDLRFLTTAQALADTAYFAQNVVFEGLEDKDLTSHETPWIAYGGSYSGGFVAFLRKLYPDTFFGAISSSGVTEAIIDYWRYYDVIRQKGPAKCIEHTQLLTNAMDNILLDEIDNDEIRSLLKATFNLAGTSDVDFSYELGERSIGAWQSRNWDPKVNDPRSAWYCGNVSSSDLLHDAPDSTKDTARRLLAAGGYEDRVEKLENPLLNWIGFFNATYPYLQDVPLRDRAAPFEFSDSSQRSWLYQVCTQWGYFQTGSGVPDGQLPLISRLVDLNYETRVCRDSYNITSPPNVEAINKYGGFNISYPRLAFIDGEWDPWVEAGVHSSLAEERHGTASEPYYLIPRSVHHWDENGLLSNETTPNLPPTRVREIQELEVLWVTAWLEEEKQERPKNESRRIGTWIDDKSQIHLAA